jgi:NAD(P)-dependent dehydrogenase (short-subunit alcohol dehydrogenase family)
METQATAAAAIVTGASRGLGLGIAHSLAHAGHPVVLAARGVEELERAAASIEALGHEAVAVPADVTVEVDAERVAGVARDRFGAVEVVVNNAGALPVVEPLDALTWERWRRSIDVDVRGVFNTTRAVAPLLRARGGGTIVNLAAAGGGAASSALHVSYSPAQAALLALSRCTGSWLAPAGVAVHCLCPSITPAGGIGVAAATAFGAEEGLTADEWVQRRLGADAIAPAEVGAAVVALLDEREGGVWGVGPRGLAAWDPFAAPVIR